MKKVTASGMQDKPSERDNGFQFWVSTILILKYIHGILDKRENRRLVSLLLRHHPSIEGGIAQGIMDLTKHPCKHKNGIDQWSI